MEIFQDYAYYYNAFYQDKDYRAEAGEAAELLGTVGGEIHRIINYGCGTGRHDLELAKLGYTCTGIDMSPEMIETAICNAGREGIRMDFSVADIREYVPEQTYDAVISLFHVMSYQNTNGDVGRAFASARAALEKGGAFLFDVWYGPGVLSDRPCVRVKEYEDGANRLVRIARPVMHAQDNTVDVNYEVFVISKSTNQVQVVNETHRMRYFFRPELEYMLEKAGFELINTVDCKTKGEPDYNTWTAYFVARAV